MARALGPLVAALCCGPALLGAEEMCNDEQARLKTRECFGGDSKALQCLKTPEVPDCQCLEQSPSVKACLAGCFPRISAAMECAGAASDGDPPRATKHDGQQSPAADHGRGGAERCEQPKAVEIATRCLGLEVVTSCLEAGGSPCQCMTNHMEEAATCLEECAPQVVTALCTPIANTTDPDQPPSPSRASAPAPGEGGAEAEAAGESSAAASSAASENPAPRPEAPGQCTDPEAAQLTKQCLAQSPVALGCIQGQHDACGCVARDPEMLVCLQRCGAKVLKVICPHGLPATMVPEDTASDHPTTAPECDDATATRLTKDCVKADLDAFACLQASAGAPECDCFNDNQGLQSCLGHCFHRVSKALCGGAPQPESPPPAVPGSAAAPDPAVSSGSVVCGDTLAADLVRSCLIADPRLVQCMTESSDRCACARGRKASLSACLGPCTTRIMAELCPRLRRAGDPAATPELPASASAAASRGACDETTAVMTAKTCLDTEPEMVACLKSPTPDCECWQAPSAANLKQCLGPCDANVEAVLCPLSGRSGGGGPQAPPVPASPPPPEATASSLAAALLGVAPAQSSAGFHAELRLAAMRFYTQSGRMPPPTFQDEVLWQGMKDHPQHLQYLSEHYGAWRP